MKPPKETRSVEGRGQPKGNPSGVAKVRTQSRVALPSKLARVNEVARRNKKARFTALMHHVDVGALERAFRRLRRGASAGVDGETVASYERGVEDKLNALHERVHKGRYKALPVRRTYIPKSDGGRRPLGIPALEDKVLQGAVAEVLGSIYEADFAGFSYGFRPGRGPHDALKALNAALMKRKVNWVLDCDVRNFFGSVDHEWLLRMVAHRVADPRLLRLIRKWLRAGALEDGVWTEGVVGTPQGAGVSPILANIFLHYILDVWVQWWRQHKASGEVIVVRYCDDFIMGFQHEGDARRALADLKERLAKFKLALNEDKTRLIEFGRFAAENRARRGLGRPETFGFLGFTHYWGKTRSGKSGHKWRTQGRRMASKLKAVKEESRRRMHWCVRDQHAWLSSVLRGHYQYYGVTGNCRALRAFNRGVQRVWCRTLRRRSSKSRLPWDRFNELLRLFPLPRPHIVRPQAFFDLG